MTDSPITIYKPNAVRWPNPSENFEDFNQNFALADNAAGIQLHVCILRVHILSCVNTLTRIGMPVKMRLFLRITLSPAAFCHDRLS